jgi:hypothetical protein
VVLKSHWKIAGWLAVAAILAIAGVVVSMNGPRDRLRAEVRRLVRDASKFHGGRGDAKALGRLLEMREAAYPVLGEMLHSNDTELSGFYYEFLRPKLPQFVARRVGAPCAPSSAQRDAAAVLAESGPVSSREINCELCRALPDAGLGAQPEILRRLLWSVPESARAVEAGSNYLASSKAGWGWQNREGRFWAGELARRMPPRAPLVAKLFHSPMLLSAMGTNAGLLIPQLLEVAAGGTNHPPNLGG